MRVIRKNERYLILSDVILCEVLRSEANSVGVTLEEYVDRFLELFYNEPQRFNSILDKSKQENGD